MIISYLTSLVIMLILFLVQPESSFSEELFEKPVRLRANGKIIESNRNSTGPCIEDLDGDGLKDLIVGRQGAFGGRTMIYKNVGRRGAPIYQEFRLSNEKNERIRLNGGYQIRFFDLNNDGIRDFVSSYYRVTRIPLLINENCSYHLGLGDQKYSRHEYIMDKAGNPVRCVAQQTLTYQSNGSFFTPVDWELDGDFDLLIGCLDGRLKLRLNEGDRKNPAFATDNLLVLAEGNPLKVKANCCPVVADWNNDGLWDIIASSNDGSVSWFQNIGAKNRPQFLSGKTLIPRCSDGGYNLRVWYREEIQPGIEVHKETNSGHNLLQLDGDEIKPGINAQIDVIDHNGDGKLDIIMTDYRSVFWTPENLTEKEKKRFRLLNANNKAKAKDFLRAYDTLKEKFNEKYPYEKAFTAEAIDAWWEAYNAMRQTPAYQEMKKSDLAFTKQILPFYQAKLEGIYRSHELTRSRYYVWLFIRK